jgi:serine/threonine protein phosphatase PrpC
MAEAARAAVRADGGDGDRWVVRAASLAGTRHRLAGSGPEDAYAWAVEGDTLTVVVADGVSNRRGSAAIAAAAASAAALAPERAVAAANEAATSTGEGSTTLVVGVLHASGTVRLVRVGDSSAFVLSHLDWQEVWPAAQEGTIRTATAALPAARPLVEEAEVEIGPGEVLVLVTDGVADPLRDGPTTVAPGLAAGLATVPEPLDLARLLDFSRQGVHDDRTLLAVWPAVRR